MGDGLSFIVVALFQGGIAVLFHCCWCGIAVSMLSWKVVSLWVVVLCLSVVVEVVRAEVWRVRDRVCCLSVVSWRSRPHRLRACRYKRPAAEFLFEFWFRRSYPRRVRACRCTRPAAAASRQCAAAASPSAAAGRRRRAACRQGWWGWPRLLIPWGVLVTWVVM